MATVDRHVGGLPIQKWLADRHDVQGVLEEHVQSMKADASGRLAAHRYEGHSFIDTSVGDVDRYLVLNDERGLRAAYMIELETNALHGASGLSIKPRLKNRRKRRRKRRR